MKTLCCLFITVFITLSIIGSKSLVITTTKPFVTTVNGSEKEPPVICYDPIGLPNFCYLWKSVQFTFNSSDNNYDVCHGNSKEVVKNHCLKSSFRWSQYLFSWGIQSLSVPPFNETCIVVNTKTPVEVALHVQAFDVWIFARLVTGFCLFYLASRLSRNILFYYGLGISLGVLTSVLIVIFVLSRFIPKKGVAIGFLAASISSTAYLLRRTWLDFEQFAYSYLHYIIIYVLLSGLLSFGVCYYKGPVSNPRAFDLMKWTIQLIGVILIYSGTQMSMVSATIVIFAVLSYFVPVCPCGDKIKKLWRRRFPPKIRLLTEEEYLEQASVETRKALDELRSFCRSPQCEAWKTISRLKSPNRFANWVEGDSEHILESEYLEHDLDPTPYLHNMDDLEDE